MRTIRSTAAATAAASLTALALIASSPATAAAAPATPTTDAAETPARIAPPAFDGGPANVSPGDTGVPGARALAAEDAPSVQELLDKCDRGEVNLCEFHANGPENIQVGEYRLAGGGENCSDSNTSREIWWASTEGETNSLGISISTSAGLKDVFETTIEATYGHEWTWSKTQTDKVVVDLAPQQTANVFVASDRSTVTGTYELNFEDRYYGHYIWYVNDVSISAPTHNTAWHTRVENGDGCG